MFQGNYTECFLLMKIHHLFTISLSYWQSFSQALRSLMECFLLCMSWFIQSRYFKTSLRNRSTTFFKLERTWRGREDTWKRLEEQNLHLQIQEPEITVYVGTKNTHCSLNTSILLQYAQLKCLSELRGANCRDHPPITNMNKTTLWTLL